jgi:hypothetical protein
VQECAEYLQVFVAADRLMVRSESLDYVLGHTCVGREKAPRGLLEKSAYIETWRPMFGYIEENTRVL